LAYAPLAAPTERLATRKDGPAMPAGHTSRVRGYTPRSEVRSVGEQSVRPRTASGLNRERGACEIGVHWATLARRVHGEREPKNTRLDR